MNYTSPKEPDLRKKASDERIPFPNVHISGFTVMRPFTAPGLFAYRHFQADNLLCLPDLGSRDMNEKQRREVLAQMVNIYRPLAATALFFGVVALEDFIRDLGTRLAKVPSLKRRFSEITMLGPIPKKNPQPYERPDKDPVPLYNWTKVNALYQKVIGIAPLPVADLLRLHDLALIRHTVAHHAALVQQRDVTRFQYWKVQEGELINPPVKFVCEQLNFLYKTGENFETAVKDKLFKKVIAKEPPNWHESPSKLVLKLIETFNWFGKLPLDDGIFLMPDDPNYKQQLREKDIATRATLEQQCIEDLKRKFRTKNHRDS